MAKIEGNQLDKILVSLLTPLQLKYKKLAGDIYVIQPLEAEDVPPIEQIRLTPEDKNQPGSPEGITSLQQALLSRISAQSLKTFLAVTGRVTTEKGEGLPGVNVLLKGTTTGAITNAEGAYSLTIADEQSNSTLVFSYIGYLSQEVPLNGRSVVDVVLKADVQSLEEVVVVGYGTVKRSDLTGSVASVSAKDLGNRSVTNIGQLLEGRVAGLDAARTSGGVNAGPKIKVRGTNSLNGNDPLWIINGMIGDPNMINPNDIESIDVLKDASATAIYGARGANGVIIVTTKKGKPGELKVDYQGFYGLATPSKRLEMLNASQYTDLLYDIYGGKYNAETGQWSAPGGLPAKLYDQQFMRTDRTNWQDELLQNAHLHDHYLSLSGGSDKLTFRASLGYKNQGQIAGNKNFKQYNLMLNTEYKVAKFARIGENISIRHQRYQGNDPNFWDGLRMPPSEGVLNPMDNNEGNYSYVTTPSVL